MYTNSFMPQPYIVNWTRDQASLMLALRTRTVRGIRTDFGNMFLDKTCPLPGCLEADSLSRLPCTSLYCPEGSCTPLCTDGCAEACTVRGRILRLPGDTGRSCGDVQSAARSKNQTDLII